MRSSFVRSLFMRSLKLLLPLMGSTLCFAGQADRIPVSIDSSQMIRLPGHADPRALPQYDQGPIEPSFQFGYVAMLFTPSAAQSKALDELPIPFQYQWLPSSELPSGSLEVANVYAAHVLDIADGGHRTPTFADAVRLHRLLDTITDASISGRRMRWHS